MWQPSCNIGAHEPTPSLTAGSRAGSRAFLPRKLAMRGLVRVSPRYYELKRTVFAPSLAMLTGAAVVVARVVVVIVVTPAT